MENIKNNVYVVGNTIVEVANKFKPTEPKKNDRIVLDIHRPENFKYKNRLENILKYANDMGGIYGLPVFMLGFKRTLDYIKEFDIDLSKYVNITQIDLLPFVPYVHQVYHSKFIISDSGTAQEEPAILGTPVIVPRDFTERPESIKYYCSFMLDVNNENKTWEISKDWLEGNEGKIDTSWLGDGTTSDKIIQILKEKL